MLLSQKLKALRTQFKGDTNAENHARSADAMDVFVDSLVNLRGEFFLKGPKIDEIFRMSVKFYKFQNFPSQFF